MLKRIKLKNFRQHEDREIAFAPGLNVIRGANEAGKTTILEAVGYALGGVDACRDPLEKIVTYGRAPKELAVELEIRYDNVDYFVKRSKAGAEVNYDGGRVVGQKDVTRFFEGLFGVPMKTMTKLMIASQGQIRGALDSGGKETMQLIESLADFDTIDRVIELIQTHLVTGPSTSAEERVAQAASVLERAQAAAVEPDLQVPRAAIDVAEAGIARLQEKIDTSLRPQYDAAKEALDKAISSAARRKALTLQHGQLLAAVERARGEQQAQQAVLAALPAEGALEAARAAVAEAEGSAAVQAVYGAFQRLVLPAVHWEGTQQSFYDEIRRLQEHRTRAQERLDSAEKQIAAKQADIRVLEAKRVTGSACGFCGKDVRDVPEVKAKNEGIDFNIGVLQGEITLLTTVAQDAKKSAAAAQGDLDALHDVLTAAKPFLDFLAKHGDRVEVKDITYPPTLSWRGAPPTGGAGELEKARAEVKRLEAAIAAGHRAAATIETLQKQIDADRTRATTLEAEAAELDDDARVAELDASFKDWQAEYNAASGEVALLQQEKAQAEAEIKAALAGHAVAKQSVANAEEDLAKARRDLETLEFNNALVKRVRQARPIVADKLWSLVLSTVSTYFSAMRGRESLVTREGNEFKVDGHTVGGGSLSGSALDCLGLALRVALTRTFLPNTPLLTLDEPAAACDADRENLLVGFIQSAGFVQTIMVTHSDAPEAIADSLVTL